MRIDFNYKKEGFYQILPVLYIKNENEKALVIGFGTNNISFVFGQNEKLSVVDCTSDSPYNIDEIDKSNKSSILSIFDKESKLTDNQKYMIVAVLGLACFSVLYYMMRRRK